MQQVYTSTKNKPIDGKRKDVIISKGLKGNKTNQFAQSAERHQSKSISVENEISFRGIPNWIQSHKYNYLCYIIRFVARTTASQTRTGH